MWSATRAPCAVGPVTASVAVAPQPPTAGHGRMRIIRRVGIEPQAPRFSQGGGLDAENSTLSRSGASSRRPR
jgi:hypothetical protein